MSQHFMYNERFEMHLVVPLTISLKTRFVMLHFIPRSKNFVMYLMILRSSVLKVFTYCKGIVSMYINCCIDI